MIPQCLFQKDESPIKVSTQNRREVVVCVGGRFPSVVGGNPHDFTHKSELAVGNQVGIPAREKKSDQEVLGHSAVEVPKGRTNTFSSELIVRPTKGMQNNLQ